MIPTPMSRKPKRGYYVRGQFVAEGSELDLELEAERTGGEQSRAREIPGHRRAAVARAGPPGSEGRRTHRRRSVERPGTAARTRLPRDLPARSSRVER